MGGGEVRTVDSPDEVSEASIQNRSRERMESQVVSWMVGEEEAREECEEERRERWTICNLQGDWTGTSFLLGRTTGH